MKRLLLLVVLVAVSCTPFEIAKVHNYHGHSQWQGGSGTAFHTWPRYVEEARIWRYLIATARIPNEVRWDRVARCESGGRLDAHSPSGRYHGLVQFDLKTWQGNGGSGDPHYQSKREQYRVAENLRRARGLSPWPNCGSRF